MNDAEIDRRLADLEAREEKLSETHKALHSAMRSIHNRLNVQQDQIKDIQTGMLQIRDVYYHVFPERLAQDAKLARILDKMDGKPPQ